MQNGWQRGPGAWGRGINEMIVVINIGKCRFGAVDVTIGWYAV